MRNFAKSLSKKKMRGDTSSDTSATATASSASGASVGASSSTTGAVGSLLTSSAWEKAIKATRALARGTNTFIFE
ncbi:hypothetical protein ACSSS7_008348 [Eimeria intestinalis]